MQNYSLINSPNNDIQSSQNSIQLMRSQILNQDTIINNSVINTFIDHNFSQYGQRRTQSMHFDNNKKLQKSSSSVQIINQSRQYIQDAQQKFRKQNLFYNVKGQQQIENEIINTFGEDYKYRWLEQNKNLEILDIYSIRPDTKEKLQNNDQEKKIDTQPVKKKIRNTLSLHEANLIQLQVKGFYLYLDFIQPVDLNIKQITVKYGLFQDLKLHQEIKSITIQNGFYISKKCNLQISEYYKLNKLNNSQLSLYFQVILEKTDQEFINYWTIFHKVLDQNLKLIYEGNIALPLYEKIYKHKDRKELKLSIRVTSYYTDDFSNNSLLYQIPYFHQMQYEINKEEKKRFKYYQQFFPVISHNKKNSENALKQQQIDNNNSQCFPGLIGNYDQIPKQIEEMKKILKQKQSNFQIQNEEQYENKQKENLNDFRECQSEFIFKELSYQEKIVFEPIELIEDIIVIQNVKKEDISDLNDENLCTIQLINHEELNAQGFTLLIKIIQDQITVKDRKGEQCQQIKKILYSQNIFVFDITQSYLKRYANSKNSQFIYFSIQNNDKQQVGKEQLLSVFKQNKQFNTGNHLIKFTSRDTVTIQFSFGNIKPTEIIQKEEVEVYIIQLKINKLSSFKFNWLIQIETNLIDDEGFIQHEDGSDVLNIESQFIGPNKKQEIIFNQNQQIKFYKNLIQESQHVLLLFKFYLKDKDSKKQFNQKNIDQEQEDDEIEEFGWVYFPLFKNNKIQQGQYVKNVFNPPIQEDLPFQIDTITCGQANLEFELIGEVVKEEKIIQ